MILIILIILIIGSQMDLCILIGSVSDGNVQYDCNKNVLVETLHTYIRQFPNNYSRKLKI